MNIVFIAGIFITVAFAIVVYVRANQQKKDDHVLFRFCQIRRNLMGELRDRYDSLTPEEFESAKFLSEALNGVIRHYRPHKTMMFNLRTVRRLISKDLRRYKKLQESVQKQLSGIPPDTKIAELYGDFSRASMLAFLSYTPFIIWEILLRFLWAEGVRQIAQIRREARNANLSYDMVRA